MEISEKDWKLYRKKIAQWQENYMEHLVRGYIDLLTSNDLKASEKFWELEGRVKKDRKHPGVIIEMKRSSALFDIAGLVCRGVITCDDLTDFSEDLQEAVRMISRR